MSATPAAATVPSTAFDPAAPVPEEYDVFCHACGYSLVGLAGDRCPECGSPFDPNGLPYARIPWLHRRRIGRARSYWQTVRLIMRRPQAFADELCRPVRISAGDARRFRSVSAIVAATSMAATVCVLVGSSSTPRWGWQDRLAFAMLLPTGWLASVVFLRLATDMPVFIWKGLPTMRPHELAPVHHYASAPLAWAPVVALFALGLPAAADFVNAPDWFYRVCVVLVILGVGRWVYLCWRTPLALMRAATGCGRRRVMTLGAYLPVHALLMLLAVALGFILCVFPIVQLVEYVERHL